MELKEEIHGDINVVSMSGKLVGGAEVNHLHGVIKNSLDKKTNKIVLDLKNVTWMGSVGIGILICCLTGVRHAGGDLKLTGANEKIKSLLRITKLEQIFEIYPNIKQAIKSFDN